MKNIQATILKASDIAAMSFDMVRQALSWVRGTAVLGWFARASQSPSFRLAVATDDSGTPLTYVPIEQTFIIRDFIVNPTATTEQSQEAGDRINDEIQSMAEKAGISKYLLFTNQDVPRDEFCREVKGKIYEITFPPRTQSVQLESHLVNHLVTPSTQFLN